MKKLPKILTIIFFSIFILQMVCLIFLLTIPQESQAATTAPVEIKFNPQVSIGQFERVECPAGMPKAECEKLKYTITPTTIGEYIQAIYNYAIGIVGILAAVVLMFGGVIWLTAGGSQEKITNAKAWIGASLSGLVLALCSYMILNTINPDLVNLKEIKPTIIPGQENYSGKAFDKDGNPKPFCCQGQIDVNNARDEFACAFYQYPNSAEMGEKEQWIMSKEVCENFDEFAKRFKTASLMAQSTVDDNVLASIRGTTITVIELSKTGACNTETGKCIK